jgi:tetratricopeptide (TPR) repeat protein
MDTRQVVARFEAERQALALMDHPNIARVFDAGATASGRPYFVMELVRGVPITEFCDQHRLTPRQRLELFVTVCQAVQHAHQKGIIHRDLKPTNVLVTLHDTVPVPKVIDFGIAKATTGPLTERTLFTHFAQMVGTPLYMSPEQAEMNGLDVDTRSDVYSLGVLLYELLSGTTPFESDKLTKVGLDEMRRLLREEEPPTPSQRLSTLDAKIGSTVSERRGVDRRRLGQVLRGDLDWIVMKALEKDRNRRYESASAFAQDVQRYLNDEAVAACPPSAGYRLRKYVRRNRRALTVAGLFAVVLVAATALSTWQAFDATAARRLAYDRLESEIKARQQAAVDSDVARAVNEFLQQDLLGQSANDPQARDAFSANVNLTMKETLDRAAARIGERFQNQPLVEAAIRTVIGQSYHNLFADGMAVPHLERAVKLREAHLSPDHPETLASMDVLSDAYCKVGRPAEGIALLQRVLDSRKRTLGPDHAETLSSMMSLAAAYRLGRQSDSCAQILENLIEKQRAIGGPAPSWIPGAMHQLALCYGWGGRLVESMTLHEKALAGFRSLYGPEHEITIWPMMTFAQVSLRAGELDRAELLLRDALSIIQKSESLDAWRAMRSNATGWLALTMHLKDRDVEAESLIRETLAFHEKVAPAHWRTCYWKSVLGVILLSQRHYEEAEPLILKSYLGMKDQEAMQGDGVELGEAVERIVQFYEATNQPEKARQWCERLLEIKSKK